MSEEKINMYYNASPAIFKRAVELRNTMTPAEEKLWEYLKYNKWQLKFRRQHPILFYVADFYCHALKLVIELDGSIHNDVSIKAYDDAREQELALLGLTILRFTNKKIFSNIQSVLNEIGLTIKNKKQNEPAIKMNDDLVGSQQTQSPLQGIGATQTEIIDNNVASNKKQQKLYIIKIGGNIIDDENKLSSFLKDYASITPLQGAGAILIHGGGKLATKLAQQMGVEQTMIDGRRITDAETLKIVTMVYAGAINKNIVAQLQAENCNAIGLCGADGNVIQAHKRQHPTIDYGFVGDVDIINTKLLQTLLDNGFSPILSPITHDKEGQLLNTNADTIAQETAKAMSILYDVELIYSFEKSGVLLDVNNEESVIKELRSDYYLQLKSEQKIFAGMIPKLDNAFAAIDAGVKKVVIGKAEELQQLITGENGTQIMDNE